LFPARHWAEPIRWNREAERAGERHQVFCCSMGDVLEDHPDCVRPREKLVELVARTPHLDWLLLTKRPENAVKSFPAWWVDSSWPRNVWLGVTVENQPAAEKRVPLLLEVPAFLRFLSYEPSLGQLDVERWLPGIHKPDCDMDDDCSCGARHPSESIHWVIAGGESGMKARPPHPDWILWMRDQCAKHGVPFFFKSWGRWLPLNQAWEQSEGGKQYWEPHRWKHAGNKRAHGQTFYAVGKKHSGNVLGGVRYEQMPWNPPERDAR